MSLTCVGYGKRESRSTLLVRSMSVLLFLCVFTSAGCKRSSPIAKIRIVTESFSWRPIKAKYDVHSDIKRKLKNQGFRIVPKGSELYDATLLIDYKEIPGEFLQVDIYSQNSKTSGPGIGAQKTEINCKLVLQDKSGNVLFEHLIVAGTVTPYRIYEVSDTAFHKLAVKGLKKNVYFKYAGEMIATGFGIGDEVTVLINALEDDDVMITGTAPSAVAELGRIGDVRAVEPLIKTLDKVENDLLARLHIASALKDIGDERAVDPLIDLLKEDWGKEIFRIMVAEELAELKSPRAVEPLISCLMNESWEVRAQAAYVLGKIGDPRAVEALISVLTDEDIPSRSNARFALKKITGEDFGVDQARWKEWWEENKEKLIIKERIN